MYIHVAVCCSVVHLDRVAQVLLSETVSSEELFTSCSWRELRRGKEGEGGGGRGREGEGGGGRGKKGRGEEGSRGREGEGGGGRGRGGRGEGG